jgi:streptogramin lyase
LLPSTDEGQNPLLGSLTTRGEITSVYVDRTGTIGPFTELASGPDGNLWLTSPTDRVARVGLDGEVTLFFDPGIRDPGPITAGPDGSMWFTSRGNDRIGRIKDGTVTMFQADDGVIDTPEAIGAGPDGNLWFTSTGNDRIGRISPDGHITMFRDRRIREPRGITAGPDGNIWFTSNRNDRIGRITPEGQIAMFDAGAEGPEAITVGPDGNLWYTAYVYHQELFSSEEATRVGRITPDGRVKTFADDRLEGMELTSIIAGPDRNLWASNPIYGEGELVRITPQGKITVLATTQ